MQFDPRTNVHRAEARHYRAIMEHLVRAKIPYKDDARAYPLTPWRLRASRDPFPHQTEALETWWNHGARGVAVLPTGTGKTFLAILAIQKAGRPAIVVTPTLPLLHQWYGELLVAFDVPVGLIGGGHYDLQPLTVTTYDSAYIHLERWGNRYGLLVFDECHHLPGPSYMAAAIGSLAPFRLGLTATPERADGQDALIAGLIGPIVYRREIKELAGDFLADFHTERLYVELTPEEEIRYRETREVYRSFVLDHGISMGGAERLAALHSRKLPLQGRATRVSGVPRTATAGAGGAGEAGTARQTAAPASRRPHAHLHARQRNRVRNRKALSRAGDHASDQSEGAAPHPGCLCER